MVKSAKIVMKDSVCDNDGCRTHHAAYAHRVYGGGPSAIYGLGFIGAVIYYISTSTGFWMGVLGFLKALIWPTFLVYELLKFLVA